jgi:PAS domain S-box-containing protein
MRSPSSPGIDRMTPSSSPPDVPSSDALDAAVRAQRQEFADAMPHVVWTHDADGVVTLINKKWNEYTGHNLEQTLAVGSRTFVHPNDREAVVAKFAEARRTGIPFHVEYRLRRHDGVHRWHAVRVFPLRASEGQVSMWIATATDLDAERRRSDEQRFLADASKILGTSLDVTKTLGDVARLVVPHLADWCAIDLLTEEGPLERAAVAHVDPTKVQLAWELWRRLPPKPEEPHGVHAVIREVRAEHFEDIPDELLAQSVTDPELLAICRSLGLRSSMCVPLIARDRVIGALSLVSAESGRRYSAGDLSFAEEFAWRIAIAVENARLYAAATQARDAAEALAAEVSEQSQRVEAALLSMRAERDAALAKLRTLEAPQ